MNNWAYTVAIQHKPLLNFWSCVGARTKSTENLITRVAIGRMLMQNGKEKLIQWNRMCCDSSQSRTDCLWFLCICVVFSNTSERWTWLAFIGSVRAICGRFQEPWADQSGRGIRKIPQWTGPLHLLYACQFRLALLLSGVKRLLAFFTPFTTRPFGDSHCVLALSVLWIILVCGEGGGYHEDSSGMSQPLLLLRPNLQKSRHLVWQIDDALFAAVLIRWNEVFALDKDMTLTACLDQ